MRMIEIFTSFEHLRKFTGVEDQHIVFYLKKIYSYLLNHDYMLNVRKLLDEKIDDNTYIEESPSAHNQISETLVQMLERPLSIMKAANDPFFEHKLLASFSSEILAKKYSKTIKFFIIPRLAANPEFPFIQLIQFLCETYEKEQESRRIILIDLTDDTQSTNKNEEFAFSSYLLHSVLKLDSLFLGEYLFIYLFLIILHEIKIKFFSLFRQTYR